MISNVKGKTEIPGLAFCPQYFGWGYLPFLHKGFCLRNRQLHDRLDGLALICGAIRLAHNKKPALEMVAGFFVVPWFSRGRAGSCGINFSDFFKK